LAKAVFGSEKTVPHEIVTWRIQKAVIWLGHNNDCCIYLFHVAS